MIAHVARVAEFTTISRINMLNSLHTVASYACIVFASFNWKSIFFEKMSVEISDANYIDYCASRSNTNTKVTVFDATPKKSIVPIELIRILIKHSSAEKESQLGLDTYINLVAKLVYDFEQRSGLSACGRNIHMITVYALLMIIKSIDDEHYTDINRVWARILHIQLSDFNRLETKFLFCTKFTVPTLEDACLLAASFKLYSKKRSHDMAVY